MIEKIREDLKNNIDPVYREGAINFFKEDVKILGVRVPIVRKIGKKYASQVKKLNKKEIFALCEKLLKSGFNEESTIAFSWLYMIRKDLKQADFAVIDRFMKYVTNWAMCDDFCTHTVSYFIVAYPKCIPRVKAWANSRNRWKKRASAVSFIGALKPSVATKKILKHVFEVSEKLLMDKDDLVQKGYGWTLKVAADIYRKEVFEFVIKNQQMPRTALRYAIEKMPRDMKDKAMGRDQYI